MPQLDILNHQVKPSVSRIGHVVLHHWQKVSYRPFPQTSQAIVKVINCSLLPDFKPILMKTTLTYVTEYEEIKLVPNYKLLSYWPAFIVLEDTLHASKQERQSLLSPSYRPCDLQREPANMRLKNNGVTNDVWEINYFLIELEAHSKITAWWSRTWDWIVQWLRGKPALILELWLKGELCFSPPQVEIVRISCCFLSQCFLYL